MQAQVAPGAWTTLRQQHGSTAVVVEHPGAANQAPADAAVTAAGGAVLCILTADCAPVAIVARSGAVAAVHAGWRGTAAGVIPNAVAVLRRRGGRNFAALVGPCIGPECYEFGADDLDAMARQFGPGVISRTAWGTPALDLDAAVRASLRSSGVEDITQVSRCTACASRHFYSHRARREPHRHAMALWIDEPE